MVPVVSKNNLPLMPCSEKRARKMLEKGEAVSQWKNQIFYIKLTKESGEDLQDVTIGIDPGSKREGFTVVTDKKVVLNILAEAREGVKEAVARKKSLRGVRRRRKTPYKTNRFNKTKNHFPPSTKARWDNKLRILNLLRKILPINAVNVEDVCAKTKKGQRKWNKSFSPLEVGKEYFFNEINKLGVMLHKTKGYTTKENRDLRGFKKTSQKLKDTWEAHCVDSHVLCEIATGVHVKPFKGMYKFEQFGFHRRQLHVQQFKRGHVRKTYGSSVSLGIARGTLVRHEEYGIVWVGGTSKGKLTIYDSEGTRLNNRIKKEDLCLLTINKWRASFCTKNS